MSHTLLKRKCLFYFCINYSIVIIYSQFYVCGTLFTPPPCLQVNMVLIETLHICGMLNIINWQLCPSSDRGRCITSSIILHYASHVCFCRFHNKTPAVRLVFNVYIIRIIHNDRERGAMSEQGRY